MSATLPTRRRLVLPPAPWTLEEAGLPFDLVLPLVLKTLHLAGEQTGAQLARRLGLRYSVIEPVLQHLRSEFLVDVSAGGLVGGPSFVYRATDAGRTRAMLFLEQSRYVGVAPVPFAQYLKYMREFDRAARRSITRAHVRMAFAHLVLSDRVLDQLGPAVNGGHSLFVYGPPGNGKTVIAQAVRNLLEGDIAIPHAIDYDGHLVQVYDPVVHDTLSTGQDLDELDAGDAPDGRWLHCRRPSVTVGGELVMSSLELAQVDASGFYRAPVQLAANGGVLVIDDFGRQRVSVVELLNRWITPLETRTDYLTLASGQKLPMPFVVLIVLATNIMPADLVDEAFLRRIHYKVFAENPSNADFKQIFMRVCRTREIPYDEAIAERLVMDLRARGVAPRGCHPRDLIDHALALADYLGAPRVLTDDLLRGACESYFVDERVSPAPRS